MESPKMFTDMMMNGAFKSMKHTHLFIEKNGKTMMIDHFEFASPMGIVGKFFDIIFLKNYLRNFLLDRNRMIRETAESDKH